MESQHSFLVNLLILIYHILKYVFLTLLGLAIVSLLINCLFKWKQVLLFVRGMLVRLRGRKDNITD